MVRSKVRHSGAVCSNEQIRPQGLAASRVDRAGNCPGLSALIEHH